MENKDFIRFIVWMAFFSLLNFAFNKAFGVEQNQSYNAVVAAMAVIISAIRDHHK